MGYLSTGERMEMCRERRWRKEKLRGQDTMGRGVRNKIKGDGRAKGNGMGAEERRGMSIQGRKGDTSGINGL